MAATVLFLFASVVLAACQGPNPVVRVAHGILQGSWKESTNGRPYASFQGVPYARPPVGKYRFREPQQLKPWSGVWDATKPLPVCLQYEPFQKSIVGSENCLYVNIATPNPNVGANLPVVIFIHGGAFMYGAGSLYDASHLMDRDIVVVTFNYRLGPLGAATAEAMVWSMGRDQTAASVPAIRTISKIHRSENCLYVNIATPNPNVGANLPVVIFIHGGAFMYGAGSLYDASHLMDRDIVVVTFNYRLGPLGFLSTGDQAAPGNAGLKDQAFALQWVKANIMMFGGNPDSVTLTGCSAGGASVHYHYLSPLSRDTFHRGIAFSGAALASWTHSVKPLQKAMALAAIVGCPTANTREMVDCLRYRPAEVVVNAQIEMFDWKVHMFTPFTPTMEPTGLKEQPFLTQYPYHASQAGSMAKVPLITSVTSEEGLYPAAAYQTDPTILPELESRWEHLASNIFEYNDTLPLHLRPAVAAKIKQKYFGGKPVSQETFPQLVQALGDRLFVVVVGKLAHIHAARSGQPTYLYRYAFRATASLSLIMAENDKDYGVSHADDVLMILKFLPMEIKETTEDKQMREALIDMIYSYATTGVPKLSNSPQWLPVQPGSPELNFLDISGPSSMQMKTSSDFGQRSFWESLGFLENEHYTVQVRDEL